MHTPQDTSEFNPSDETVQQAVRQALQRYEGQKGNLLPILHAVQHTLGYIPSSAVPLLAQALQLSRAEIHGVISFYAHRSEEHTSELQSLMRISYAVFCLKKTTKQSRNTNTVTKTK